MKKYLVGIFILANSWLFAQTAPKYSNEFLAIGVGARAAGMGNAQAAICNDVTAAYWNPAGLLSIKDTFEVALMHSQYFGGIANYDYAALAIKLDTANHLAFSLIRFGVDNIPDTRLLIGNDGSINYDNVSSFSEASYAGLISYARKTNFWGGVRLGANVKIIYRSAGVFAKAWGFGLDVGLQKEFGKWTLGVMAKDISSTFNYWNFNTDALQDVYAATGNQLIKNSVEVSLPRVAVDVARSFAVKNVAIWATAGLDITTDGKRNTLLKSPILSADLHAGVEVAYQQKFFVRGGIGNFQKLQDFNGQAYTGFQPNFGVGFVFKNFTIDYALANLSQSVDAVSLLSHIFSVKMRFNAIKLPKNAIK